MTTATNPVLEFLRKRAAFISPGIVLLFIIMCVIFLPARYETNDEIANIDSLNPVNEFCGNHPTPLIGKMTGIALSFLYHMFPDIPWYGIIVYLFIFAGLSLMMNLALKHLNVTNNVIYVITLMFLSFHIIVITSFTAATLILEFAVFLCFMEFIVRDSGSTRKDKLYFYSLCALLTFSFLIRWKVAFLFGILACPAVMFLKGHQARKWRLPVLIAITIIGADRILDEMTNTDEDRYFASFSKWRTEFHDTSKGSFHESMTPIALKSAGWTEEDYRFYKFWILYDDELFNVNKLRLFINENTRLNPHFDLLNKANYYKSMEVSETSTYFVMCFLLAFIILNIRFIAGLKRDYLYKYLIMSGFIFAVIVVCTYYRFPQRIHIPLYIMLTSTIMICSSLKCDVDIQRRKEKSEIACYLLSLAIMSLAVYPVWKRMENINAVLWKGKLEKEYFKSCLSAIEDMCSYDPVVVMMNPSDSLGSAFIHPLMEYGDYPKIKRMIGGMNTNSARYHHALRILGLKTGREFMKWTIDNKRILFALVVRTDDQRKRIEGMWNSYYNRRISEKNKVSMKPVYDARGVSKQGLVIYRMCSETD